MTNTPSLVNTPHRLRKAAGIDLGAHACKAVLLDATDSAFLVARDDQGRRSLPCVVGPRADGAGLAAGPDTAGLPVTVTGIKQLLGREGVQVGDAVVPPASLAAALLQRLRAALGQAVNDRRHLLDQAVLTVPADWDERRQAELREAARLAGFADVELLPEPAAVALYYAWAGGHADATYLTIDLGDNTHTVAVVRVRAGAAEVLAAAEGQGVAEVGAAVVRRAGVALGDIDHVALAGDGARLADAVAAVRAAFCEPALAEHVRGPEPLCHEPELAVACGAAVWGARRGLHYLLEEGVPTPLDLHLTSAPLARTSPYPLTGVVAGARALGEGASVRIQAQATGLVEEAFLDESGAFAQELELPADEDNGLQLTLCDDVGREVARVPATVRHRAAGRQLGQDVPATQLVTRALALEVFNRNRQRVKQVLAPVGATLPGTFACTCRTTDQAGFVVLPLYEEGRLLKRLVVGDLDAGMPPGAPVEIELRVDAERNLLVKVVLRAAARIETFTLQAPPPPRRPGPQEVAELQQQIETLLGQFSGPFHERNRDRLRHLLADLHDALRRDDEATAGQRLSELRELHQQVQTARAAVLEPPWQRFAQLVKRCLIQAGTVAERTGRSREELFEQVYAQERYAEQAFEEKNQTMYRECFENLSKFAAYLEHLENDFGPGAGGRAARRAPTTPEAKREAKQVEQEVQGLLRRAQAQQRGDLVERLEALARQAGGLAERAGPDPGGCLRDVQRLRAELARVETELTGVRLDEPDDDDGMLEGSF